MIRTSAIQHPKNDPFLLLRNSYLGLCGGDACQAGALASVEFWINGELLKRDKGKAYDDETRFELPPNKLILLGDRSKVCWENAMLCIYSGKWILKAVRSLIDVGILFVQVQRGKTSTYWVNPRRIQQALDNYKDGCYNRLERDKSPLSQIALSLGWSKSDCNKADLNNAFFVSNQLGNKYSCSPNRPQNQGINTLINQGTNDSCSPNRPQNQGINDLVDQGINDLVSQDQGTNDLVDQGINDPVESSYTRVYTRALDPDLNIIKQEIKQERKKTQKNPTPAYTREENPDLCVCVSSGNVATKVKEEEAVQVQVEIVQPEPEPEPESELSQTGNQDKQPESFASQNKKNLGEDQSSGACDNKIFGIPVENLEAIATKFDQGIIQVIPDRELKALAQLRVGEEVKLYRKSGLVCSSKPNDILIEFARWFAWSHLGQENEIQFALNTIAKYELNPSRWQVLVVAVREWQECKANPELLERKFSKRSRFDSEVESQLRVRRLDRLAQRTRARRAAELKEKGNIPEPPQAAVKEPQECQHVDISAESQPPEQPEHSPMPDSLRQKLKAISDRNRAKEQKYPVNFQPSIVPIRPNADYGGYDF